MKNEAMRKIRDTLKLAESVGDEAFVHRLCGMAQGYAAAMTQKPPSDPPKKK